MRKDIMLATKFDQNRFFKQWKGRGIAQPKLDGVRCRCIIDEHNETTLYSVGDLVWKKDVLDTYLSVEETMRPILSFDVNQMLFKVKRVNVNTSDDSTYLTFYDLEPYDTSAPNSATTDDSEIQHIQESNLYSKTEGTTSIDTKYADFKAYINSIS